MTEFALLACPIGAGLADGLVGIASGSTHTRREELKFSTRFDEMAVAAFLPLVITVEGHLKIMDMFGVRFDQDEVVQGVIETIPVPVVDHLSGDQVAAEVFGHDKAVGGDLLTSDHPVKVPSADTAALPMGRIGAAVGRTETGIRTVSRAFARPAKEFATVIARSGFVHGLQDTTGRTIGQIVTPKRRPMGKEELEQAEEVAEDGTE